MDFRVKMSTTIGTNKPRIITDGFRLFGHRPVQIATFMISQVYLLQSELSLNAIEIFRSFKIDEDKVRHDKCKVTFDMADQSLILSNIYLTPEFGISVIADPAIARFEIQQISEPTDFGKIFQFETTTNGFKFEPHCYYKIL